MKTLQDLYSEIMASDELKKALAEATKAGTVDEFLREHGCDVSLDELEEFLAGIEAQDAPIELSMDQLLEVAGGAKNTKSILTQTVQCPNTNECSNTCIRDCC